MRYVCSLIALALLAPPVAAQDASSALEAFGLVGTWATDCTVDIRTVCTPAPAADRINWTCGARTLPDVPSRVTFATPAGKPATRTSKTASFVDDIPAITASWTIGEATRLGDDRLKLRMTFIDDDWKRPAGVNGPDDKGIVYDLVLQKKDGRIRTIDFVRVDGSRIYAKDGWRYGQQGGSKRRPWETPSFERCTN
jgi:hypothetical protein